MERTEAFRLLASADRQLVLHELVERDGEATVAELSEQVAARRHRTPSEKIDDGAIERARVRLAHTHLPRLAENGIVDVDWPGGDVVLADEECVDRLFSAAAELETWPPEDLLEPPSS